MHYKIIRCNPIFRELPDPYGSAVSRFVYVEIKLGITTKTVPAKIARKTHNTAAPAPIPPAISEQTNFASVSRECFFFSTKLYLICYFNVLFRSNVSRYVNAHWRWKN